MSTLRHLTLQCSGRFTVEALGDGRVVLELHEVNTSNLPGSDPDPIYDKKDIAARLHTTVRNIDNYMRQKKSPLPYCKIGGLVRFRESEIQQWLSGSGSTSARRSRKRLGL